MGNPYVLLFTVSIKILKLDKARILLSNDVNFIRRDLHEKPLNSPCDPDFK